MFDMFYMELLNAFVGSQIYGGYVFARTLKWFACPDNAIKIPSVHFIRLILLRTVAKIIRFYVIMTSIVCKTDPVSILLSEVTGFNWLDDIAVIQTWCLYLLRVSAQLRNTKLTHSYLYSSLASVSR